MDKSGIIISKPDFVYIVDDKLVIIVHILYFLKYTF